MNSILWRRGLRVSIDKNANDVRRWLLSGWVEGAVLASAAVTVVAPPDPAFLAVIETVGADYVDVRITPSGVAVGGIYAVMVAPTITSPALRVDNFTVEFLVVDQ